MDRKTALRIIDANSNRAREGARVVEDIARFVLSDGELAGGWKKIRHMVSRLSCEIELSQARFRDAAGDPGRKLNTGLEPARQDFISLAKANAKRTEEALRALEEFSKFFSDSAAEKFREIRFEAYGLEKTIMERLEELVQRKGM